MAISKKKRFDILKRDNFTCQYCGRKTPDVLLEIDHIIPKSKKGTDLMDNLLTSCFDCNRGKAANELSCVPEVLSHKIKIIEEKRKQYLQYKRLIKKQEKLLLSDIEEVNNIYKSYYPEYELSDRFRSASVSKFIKALGVEVVKDAMNRSCHLNSTNSIRYFCGICWNKIREKNE